MKAKQKTTKPRRFEGFSQAEKSAMQSRVQEMKLDRVDEEAAALAKIRELKEPDRSMAKRLHVLIKAVDPGISAKTYYGMPAYAKDGKTLCWYKPAQKFKQRYATLEFGDAAKLDQGTMWPVSYALTTLSAADESTVKALVKKAAG
jgi:hypothetical protein